MMRNCAWRPHLDWGKSQAGACAAPGRRRHQALNFISLMARLSMTAPPTRLVA
jgi:hypothetical protein